MSSPIKTMLMRFIFLLLIGIAIAFVACYILATFGLSFLMICGAMFAAVILAWIAWWLQINNKLDTSKIIVFILIYIGALMAGFSYYLAYLDKTQIAESLSIAAIVQLVAPAALYLLKSLTENLSKNNTWPDKSAKCKETGTDNSSI